MLIIDGHNLIGSFGLISDPKAKEKLLEKINEYQIATELKTIVVFDGANFDKSELTMWKNIEIRYGIDNETADDVIKNFISRYKNQHGIRIVSSDREIIDRAKKSHLEVEKCASFKKELNETISHYQDTQYKDEYFDSHTTEDWLNWYEKEKLRLDKDAK